MDTTLVPTKPGQSRRAVAEVRVSRAECGVCHSRFEPLAFGLERFNGIGAYHETDEHGNLLRDDGEILFPGGDKPVPYRTSSDLMNLLAASERVRETITWKLTQFAVGRPLTSADKSIVDRIHQQAQARGGTYPALITAIIQSDLV